MPSARELLEQYVTNGKLMQVATLRPDGSPEVCNVWYDPHFSPDLLRFISRHDRNHSVNIRNNGRAAGSIIAIHLEALGQVARGVTFIGTARELPLVGVESAIGSFVARWPFAIDAIDADRLVRGDTPTRIYEVAVHEWILFDEANFPEQPRQVIEPARIVGPSRERSGTGMQFRIHHVAISVRDMRESIEFYGAFGFKVAVRYEDPDRDFEVVHMKLNDAFLELWCYKSQIAAPESAADLSADLPRIGIKHMALQVPSIDDAKRSIEARGIPIAVQRREGNTGVTYFFIKDPSGNLLEILEDNRSLS